MRMLNAIRLTYSKKPYILLSIISGSSLILLYYYLIKIGYIFTPVLLNSILLGRIFDIIGFFIISILFAISISMVVYMFHIHKVKKNKSETAGALVVGVFTQMLCCTPIIGSLLVILGFSTSTVLSTAGIIQGTFVELEPILVIVSIGLLIFSIKANANSILGCKTKKV